MEEKMIQTFADVSIVIGGAIVGSGTYMPHSNFVCFHTIDMSAEVLETLVEHLEPGASVQITEGYDEEQYEKLATEIVKVRNVGYLDKFYGFYFEPVT
jgi:hypothetical protein